MNSCIARAHFLFMLQIGEHLVRQIFSLRMEKLPLKRMILSQTEIYPIICMFGIQVNIEFFSFMNEHIHNI